MKYRKMPVEIEAIQWTGNNLAEIEEFVVNEGGKQFDTVGDSLFIHTLEGSMRAKPTDYIIKGVKGEFYPCDESIFRITYEQVK
jgi:hypothetical protein